MLSDSLNEISKLKINFENMFNKYNNVLPEYHEMCEKINLLESSIKMEQLKLNNMDKKIDDLKTLNKQKLKKIEN